MINKLIYMSVHVCMAILVVSLLNSIIPSFVEPSNVEPSKAAESRPWGKHQDIALVNSLAKWLISNKDDQGRPAFNKVTDLYKFFRKQEGGALPPTLQGSNHRYVLSCENAGSSGVPEESAKWFVFDVLKQSVDISQSSSGEIAWRLSQDYNDSTQIEDLEGGTVHKLIVFSSRATVPNMMEVYLHLEPISLRWVYIMGQQTEEIVFLCRLA